MSLFFRFRSSSANLAWYRLSIRTVTKTRGRENKEECNLKAAGVIMEAPRDAWRWQCLCLLFPDLQGCYPKVVTFACRKSPPSIIVQLRKIKIGDWLADKWRSPDEICIQS
ncbi:uncharacterized protein LOC144650674 isoform X1 [Oculina patagonica]